MKGTEVVLSRYKRKAECYYSYNVDMVSFHGPAGQLQTAQSGKSHVSAEQFHQILPSMPQPQLEGLIFFFFFTDSQSTHSEGKLPPVGVRLLEDGEELQDGEFAPVMIDTQVLSLALQGGEGTHGHSDDGVTLDQLPHGGALVLTEVQTHILKGSFLGAQSGCLEKQRVVEVQDHF